MWGWGWLAAERWDAARRASASPGKAGDSSCAFSLTQCHQEGRVCFSHCLPNFPIPRASSNFFAFSLAQDMPFYALLDLLVTAHGEPQGFLLHLCFASKSQVLCPMVSWSLEVILAYPGYFGTEAVPAVLQQHSGPCCFAWSMARLSCCSVEGPWQSGASCGCGRCEHRQALLCQQSARGDGFCSISRPPIQVQALLAPVKLSDNL